MVKMIGGKQFEILLEISVLQFFLGELNFGRPAAHDFFHFFNFLTKVNAAFVYFRSRKKNAKGVDFAPRSSDRFTRGNGKISIFL